MPLVSIRFTDAEKNELEYKARGNISAYIRARLFDESAGNELLIERFDTFRDEVLETVAAGGRSTGGDAELTVSLLIELLMILRQTQSRTIRETAQREVERLGLPVFESESYKTKGGGSA